MSDIATANDIEQRQMTLISDMPLVLIIILQQQMTYKYVHVAGLGGWVELLGRGLQLTIKFRDLQLATLYIILLLQMQLLLFWLQLV